MSTRLVCKADGEKPRDDCEEKIRRKRIGKGGLRGRDRRFSAPIVSVVEGRCESVATRRHRDSETTWCRNVGVSGSRADPNQAETLINYKPKPRVADRRRTHAHLCRESNPAPDIPWIFMLSRFAVACVRRPIIAAGWLTPALEPLLRRLTQRLRLGSEARPKSRRRSCGAHAALHARIDAVLSRASGIAPGEIYLPDFRTVFPVLRTWDDLRANASLLP
jgi:hypothetical protein